ncbi:MAG TPA: metal ABC transporter ATP-binding protein [Gemmatales bacterium]|nr:metal ABC transporter ATP-binding protein [Gemmatales bacterium]
MTKTPILDVHDMTVAYHHKPVLWNIDVTLTEPSLVGVMGPNGAGKSTLIKAILGLVPRAGGEVRIFGQPLSKVRGRIGYVPQRESVDWDFPINVFDLVLMGTYGQVGWFRNPGRKERGWALECMNDLGISDLAGRQIGQLSGGQQQRAFLARALAQKADIYFMDEPMAGVDASTEEAVFKLLQRLRSEGKMVIVVHHDIRSAPQYFDQMLLLNTRLVAAGPTSEVFKNEYLQRTYGGRLMALETAGVAMRDKVPSA